MSDTHIKSLFLYLVTGVLLVSLAAVVLWRHHAQEIDTHVRFQMGEILLTINERLDPVLRTAASDLLLSRLHPRIVADVENGGLENVSEIAAYFKTLALHDPYLAQLRLIGADGRERVRVERGQGGIRVVPSGQLQDKSDHEYFTILRDQAMDSLYVSGADLNREFGKIETPYNPVLRLGLPLRNAEGRFAGALISNISLERLLSASTRNAGTPGLHMTLNKQGAWLVSPDPAKQWGHVLDHGARFENDFPDIWKKMEKESVGAVIQTDKGIFGFRHYFPVMSLRADLHADMGIVDPSGAQLPSDGLRWTFLIHRPSDSRPSPWDKEKRDLWVIYGIAVAVTVLLAFYVARVLESRRRATADLAREERRYRGLVQSTSQIVWTTDTRGISRPSESWMAFTGQTAEQTIGLGWLDAVHPDDRDMTLDTARHSMENGLPIRTEYRLRRHDGTWRAMDVRGVPVRDENGTIEEWVGMCIDITERRQVEANLIRHEERYRALVEAGAQIVWTNGPDGKTREYSESWHAFTGQSEAESSGYGWINAIHPDDHPKVRKAAQASFATGDPISLDFRLRRQDGEWRVMAVSGVSVRDTAGQIVEWVGMCVDVTDRRRIKAELELFKQMIEVSTDPFYLINLEAPGGRFVYVNQAAEKHWGRPREELLRLGLSDIDEDITPEQVARILKESISKPNRLFEATHKRPDGIKIPVIVSASRILWDGQVHTYGYVRDIGAIKENETALRTARDQAEKANRAKSEFLSAMSHELRTPMNAILGFAQLIKMEQEGKGDARIDMEIKHILEAGNHLLGLIDDVLDLTRVESANFTVSLQEVDPRKIIESSLASIHRMQMDRNLTIADETAGMDLPLIKADTGRTRQVTLNLLTNAAKYNRPNGWINVSATCTPQNFLRITIRDGGFGISQAKQSRLFIPFDRLGHENSSIEGTGIGLVICQRLLEEMGGKMGYQSEEGVGSTFWFELPLLENAASTHPAAVRRVGEQDQAPLDNPSVRMNGRKTILYVEDNPSNIKVVERIMKRQPTMGLRIALSAEEAFAQMATEQPDLVLMDINLPGMDGIEAVRRLKSDPSLCHIPVIAVTARAMAGDADRGMAAGFDAYVIKPFQIDKLLETIQRVLDSSTGSSAK